MLVLVITSVNFLLGCFILKTQFHLILFCETSFLTKICVVAKNYNTQQTKRDCFYIVVQQILCNLFVHFLKRNNNIPYINPKSLYLVTRLYCKHATAFEYVERDVKDRGRQRLVLLVSSLSAVLINM